MVDGSAVAEILEARKKKGKGGKKGGLPGPLIGYLMKKGVIGKGRKFRGKKRIARAEKDKARKRKRTNEMILRRKNKDIEQIGKHGSLSAKIHYRARSRKMGKLLTKRLEKD